MSHSTEPIPKVDRDHLPAAGVPRFDSSHGGGASTDEAEDRGRQWKDSRFLRFCVQGTLSAA